MRQLAIFAVSTLAAAGSLAARPPLHRPPFVASSTSFSCRVASIHDGDTFRCADGTRIRVAGIDARELDGSCAPGHPCASAPPEAATAALRRLVNGQVLRCQSNGMSYRRVAAWCRRTDGVDVSCAMLRSGTVARWDKFWRGRRC